MESALHACLALMLSMIVCAANDAHAQCTLVNKSVLQHEEIGKIPILRDSTTNAVVFASQMQVNTDGASDSYHPDDIGITHICNGVSVGASCTWKASCLADFKKAKVERFNGPTKIFFFAMATQPNGKPILQGPNDPKPGFFVSTTALQQPGADKRTTQAQLDLSQTPFIMIPQQWQQNGKPGPKLGDFAVVLRKSTDDLYFAIDGDIGPRNKLGESSVALHQTLGNDPFVIRFGKLRARRGIGGNDVVYIAFPNSAKRGEQITNTLI